MTTTTVKFDNGENMFAENFVAMEKLTGLNLGLHSMKQNSVMIDTTHGLILFRHLTVEVKSAYSQKKCKTSTYPQRRQTDKSAMTTKTINTFVHHLSERKTTGTVKPLERFTETTEVLIFHSIATSNDKKNSSQSNQCNSFTLHNQKVYTDCRVVRSDSGTIHLLKQSPRQISTRSSEVIPT